MPRSLARSCARLIATGILAVTPLAVTLLAVTPLAGAARADADTRPAAPLADGGGPRAVVGGPLLAGRGVIVDHVPRPVPRLPNVAASSFVVADAGTGQVLAAKDPHGRYRPASTLKVLTAVTFIPLLNPDATVVAEPNATSVVPNIAGLVTGHRYRVTDLFTALLTISANDAAVALADADGSYTRGIALMNAEARRLHALDTVAVDPNGLDAPGQHTSAYDLALIARQALTLPAFMRYDQTRVARFPVTSRRSETLYNQNRLLTQYPGGIGGKIGWTSAAGATYIGLARRHGVTLIVTLMHCPALTEIASAERLLTWGFAADGKVRPVGALVSPAGPASPSNGASPSKGASPSNGPSPTNGASTSNGASTATPGRPAHDAPASRDTAASQDTPAVSDARTARQGHAAAVHAGGDGAAPAVAAFAFSGVAVLAAVLGFAATRRRRRGAER